MLSSRRRNNHAVAVERGVRQRLYNSKKSPTSGKGCPEVGHTFIEPALWCV